MENTGTACCVLKNDLIVSRQDNGDGAFYIVKDPSTERFFRFKEIEGYIAQQCDGQIKRNHTPACRREIQPQSHSGKY